MQNWRIGNARWWLSAATVDLSGSPDLSKLSEAFGLRFMRLSNMEGAQETIRSFLEKDESVLLECLIDPMDLV